VFRRPLAKTWRGPPAFVDCDEVDRLSVQGDSMQVLLCQHGLADLGLAILVGIAQEQEVARLPPSDVGVAICRDGDHAGFSQAVGEDRDLEAGRNLQRPDALGRGWDDLGTDHMRFDRDRLLCPE
jgi:hypothetical protein